MKEKFEIDRKAEITFSAEFVRACGRFELSEQNILSARIKEVSFDDMMLIRCPSDEMSGTDFSNYIEESGLIPADAYVAYTIIWSNQLLCKLEELISKGGYYTSKGFNLETINFFGSRASDGKKNDYIYCFKYGGNVFKENPQLMVFENEPFWGSSCDLALVFNAKFSKKIKSQMKAENDARLRLIKKKAEEKEKQKKKLAKQRKKASVKK